MAKELPKRSEVSKEFTWAVEDLYPSVEAWKEDIAKAQGYSDEVAAYAGKVGACAKNVYEVCRLDEESEKILTKAFSYASRMSDVDTKNTENQALVLQIRSIYMGIASKTAFVVPELLEIPEETLEQYYKDEPGLELYRKMIEEIQRVKAHRLSAEMEAHLAQTAEVTGAPQNVFSMFNNADVQFPEIEDENGELVRITHGRFIPLLESANRRVRKDAFQAVYKTYEQFKNTLAAAYSGEVKGRIFEATARKYNSTLEAAVDANNVSPDVYKTLVEVINENLDKMHRYVRLRKKCLGLDEIHMYDIYTPMVADSAVKVPFEQAKETILEALKPLGDDYLAMLKEGFENRWIDVYENEGKRSGAYSAGAYGCHPFVLLNYVDTLDNQFTLAHEMGHALHSYLSNKNQPFVYSHYKIFVAEVASTCNEVLLIEHLLANTTDKKERMYLLNHYLDSFKGTVYRQTMFAEYEMITNAMAERGESLTAEVLKKVYLELNEKYYGSDMVSDPEIAIEWARIPHFYYNFYVYQYATGFSAAVAIAHKILEEGQSAVENYKKFLSGGCSEDPVSLLKIAGVDITKKESIQAALDVFGSLLDEMEKLVEE